MERLFTSIINDTKCLIINVYLSSRVYAPDIAQSVDINNSSKWTAEIEGWKI